MDRSRPDRSERRMSDLVRRLVDARSRGFPDARARAVEGADLRALRELVAAGEARPPEIKLSRAMMALAIADPSPRTAQLLTGIATAERESLADRAVAASALARVPVAAARRGLLETLRAPSPLIRIEALRSLACIGDRSSLAGLAGIDAPPNSPELRQLRFARSVIAHRLGQRSDDLPFRSGAVRTPGPEDELIELSLRPIRPRTVARERELLQGSPWSIETSPRIGFALEAGKARWTVFVNAEVISTGSLTRGSRIFERPWLLALLARHNDLTPTTAVQYVVLSDPDADGATIMVVRPDGEVFYSGRLGRPKGVLSFLVRDIVRRGTAPTNVSGRLTGRGVEFDVLLPFGARRDKQVPMPAHGTPPATRR